MIGAVHVKRRIAAAVLIAISLTGGPSLAFDLTLSGKTPVSVFFAPGNYLDAVISRIDSAKSEILIQSYYFGSVPVADALIRARKGGVRVAVIMDRSARAEGVTPGVLMSNEGITVLLDKHHYTANSRVMIVDARILCTGSFDFNRASEEKNSENLLILDSPELARLYRDNWLKHREHSEPY